MIQLKLICAIMVFCTLTSCTSHSVPIIYDCPKIVLPQDPIPPVKMLTSKSTPDEVMKAWVSTAKMYRDWNTIVRNQIQQSK